MARVDYDGVDCDVVLRNGETITSNREHVQRGDGEWWTGRVYALQHPDPSKCVLAVDAHFCGELSRSRVVDWRGTVGHAEDLTERELDRHVEQWRRGD